MAKLSVVVRNRKRKEMIEKYAERRKILKQKGDYEALDRLPRNASPVRYVNRCGLTGRSRGYIRRFGVCRIIFRDMASDGKIPGVKKTSW
ncbi:MAG: 30S ribosomal protein S14 [Cytophagales bacterium]|nr:30S ribosomal protein S14 [Cytophagales bacterium]